MNPHQKPQEDVVVTQLERFMAKVDRRGDGECWPWLGKLHSGYGSYSLNGRGLGAHRASAILHGLPVVPKLHVDHICRNRACVNPAHLRVVPPRVNALENSVSLPAINSKKTHCKRGHLLSEDNVIANTLHKKGWRSCKKCKSLWNDSKPRKTPRKRGKRLRGMPFTKPIPQGWMCVPLDPSEAMLDAFWGANDGSQEMRLRDDALAIRGWKAMLSVVPPEPLGGEQP